MSVYCICVSRKTSWSTWFYFKWRPTPTLVCHFTFFNWRRWKQFCLLRHVNIMWSVWLYVCVSFVTLVCPAKAVGQNEMPFGRDTCIPSNTVLDGDNPPREGEILGSEPPICSDVACCQITLPVVSHWESKKVRCIFLCMQIILILIVAFCDNCLEIITVFSILKQLVWIRKDVWLACEDPLWQCLQ